MLCGGGCYNLWLINCEKKLSRLALLSPIWITVVHRLQLMNLLFPLGTSLPRYQFLLKTGCGTSNQKIKQIKTNIIWRLGRASSLAPTCKTACFSALLFANVQQSSASSCLPASSCIHSVSDYNYCARFSAFFLMVVVVVAPVKLGSALHVFGSRWPLTNWNWTSLFSAPLQTSRLQHLLDSRKTGQSNWMSVVKCCLTKCQKRGVVAGSTLISGWELETKSSTASCKPVFSSVLTKQELRK